MKREQTKRTTSTEQQSRATIALPRVGKKALLIVQRNAGNVVIRDVVELQHHFIIKLIAVAMDDDNLYFVFENCENGDLADLI